LLFQELFFFPLGPTMSLEVTLVVVVYCSPYFQIVHQSKFVH